MTSPQSSPLQPGWGEWRPIETAPHGERVLLYGPQTDHLAQVRYMGPLVFSGYWDAIDEAWCATGSTWEGPFFEPTHWMPLPSPPPDTAR